LSLLQPIKNLVERTNRASAIEIRAIQGAELPSHLSALESYVALRGQMPLSFHPAWLTVLEKGLSHVPYCLHAVENGKTRGFLALSFVRSLLFGRFLVSMPYLNYGGILADNDDIATLLLDRAAELANELDVRYLEIRHVSSIANPALTASITHKVHMHRDLPATLGQLWDELSAKVRNQVRNGQKKGLTITWGRHDLLPEFYAVFSRNMRDLGTPCYGRRLFAAILDQFPQNAELCVARCGDQAVAGALLLHGWGVTEVPSASSLRQFNHTNANMLMYWHLLERAVMREQRVFDFGRSTRDSNTFRFKRQWGAKPCPAEWQYHLRKGQIADMRPENPSYRWLIYLWRKLPLSITRLIGPSIVRGIP
jgi:FemAB-related protein (PEP-CTERM system-associated)